MAKSDENVLLFDVERLNSRLIKHREIEHNSVMLKCYWERRDGNLTIFNEVFRINRSFFVVSHLYTIFWIRNIKNFY